MNEWIRLKWYKDGSPAAEKDWHLDMIAPHQILVCDASAGTSNVKLDVLKKNVQTLDEHVPYSADTVVEYWRRGGWHEIEKHEEGNKFFAIRYIPLPSGYIVWVVNHKAQVADDQLKWHAGTIEEMIVKFARVHK